MGAPFLSLSLSFVFSFLERNLFLRESSARPETGTDAVKGKKKKKERNKTRWRDSMATIKKKRRNVFF